MNATLFLYSDERAAFDALPEDVREGWSAQDETSDAYESVRQIAMRYGMADFGMHPSVKDVMEQIQKGIAPDKVSLAHIGPDIQKEFYYMIGARGVRALMQSIMPTMRSDEDVEAFAALSVVRHKLLELNASTTRR